MAQEVSHDVTSLIKIVENIRSSADKFRISGNELMIIDRAKSDHLMFIEKIQSHLRGHAQVDPATLPDHHGCRFGKWYYSDGKKHCGQIHAYQAIEKPHAHIHELAKKAVTSHMQGDVKTAESIFKDMRGISEQITKFLGEMKQQCTKNT